MYVHMKIYVYMYTYLAVWYYCLGVKPTLKVLWGGCDEKAPQNHRSLW